MTVAVIGSGFAGVFAAHALAARGLSVEILDVGEELDDQRQAVVARLRAVPPASWPSGDHDLIRHNPTLNQGELPKKMHFGSDYIYADNRHFAPLNALAQGRAPYPTFAKGGFSNVWGAAMLPSDACDMADWPVTPAEMEPYFNAVGRLLPLCGGSGTLSRSFPAHTDRLGALDPGPQGRALLADLHRAESALLAVQTLYGEARLAVHTMDEPGALSCTGCGHCFTGCVRGSIFATLPLLNALIGRGHVSYRAGLYVDRVAEQGDRVAVEAVELSSGTRCGFTFDGVFIAAGPINTTRLLLRSRQLYDRTVTLKESQKFIVPMLRRQGAMTAIESASPTLAAAFIEAKVPSSPDHWLHVQVVAMNRMLLDAIGAPTGRLATLLARPILRRLMVAWCGMHSDHSSEVALRLRRVEGGGPDVLELELRVREEARAAACRAARDLAVQGRLFRTTFLPRLIQFANPGSGTHCGSSFPMRERPNDPLDTDRLGRPFGWTRVFAVDASVLPSIPGTTLALSVMANAYRIASLAPF